MKKFIFFLFFVFLYSVKTNCKTINIALIDTNNTEIYKYNSFVELANTAGFKIDYKSIADILDEEEYLNSTDYDGIFFITGIEFLKGIATRSQVSIKFLKLLKNFAQNKNKLISFMLPPINNHNIKNKLLLFAPLFNCLNINMSVNGFIEKGNIVNSMEFKIINNYLNVPFESKRGNYETTLSEATHKITKNTQNINTNSFTTLPINSIKHDNINSLTPYGIYWLKNNNSIFITSNSLLSFSGISENFHFCPTNFELRKKIHKNILIMLTELKYIFNNNNSKSEETFNVIDYTKLKNIKISKLPSHIKNMGNKIETKKAAHLKKVAWLDMNIFEKTDSAAINAQDKLINSITKSSPGLTLWITLNPQMYYSPIAKKKSKTNVFIKSISLFTKKLNKSCQKLNIKRPKILIGFEIANNLYEPNLPKKHAVDIYKNIYRDIPNPIDNSFWNQEVLNPLNKFLDKWQEPNVNNNIKISGIVLDLEMYCRKTSSNFLDTTGFNLENIKKFGRTNINDLIKNKESNLYFKFLKNQAINIGKKIKNIVNNKIENGIIGCYAPNISTNWFYTGLYSGLSSKDNPLQLLTFNSEFNIHQKWLLSKKIYANHLSALMLSKIKTPKNFKRINKKLEHNHGVWFNKFSRFAEKRHNDWMSVEQSKLTPKDEEKFFKFIKSMN